MTGPKPAIDYRHRENKDRATPHTLRQFRYIYWIDRRAKKRVLLRQLPYPKHYEEGV